MRSARQTTAQSTLTILVSSLFAVLSPLRDPLLQSFSVLVRLREQRRQLMPCPRPAAECGTLANSQPKHQTKGNATYLDIHLRGLWCGIGTIRQSFPLLQLLDLLLRLLHLLEGIHLLQTLRVQVLEALDFALLQRADVRVVLALPLVVELFVVCGLVGCPLAGRQEVVPRVGVCWCGLWRDKVLYLRSGGWYVNSGLRGYWWCGGYGRQCGGSSGRG